MSVRAATVDDIEPMVAMGRRFIRSTRYADVLTENPDQMRTLIHWLLDSEQCAAFVAEKDGGLVGMMGVTVFDHPISGQKTASELFWWMNPDARGGGMRLYHAAERWAGEQGAEVLQMIAPSKDVAELYLRLGFAQVETLFQRSLVKSLSQKVA